MKITIDDVKKVDYDPAKTEEELIRILEEKINILTEYIKNLRIQIKSADGYQIKVIDLRKDKDKDKKEDGR